MAEIKDAVGRAGRAAVRAVDKEAVAAVAAGDDIGAGNPSDQIDGAIARDPIAVGGALDGFHADESVTLGITASPNASGEVDGHRRVGPVVHREVGAAITAQAILAGAVEVRGHGSGRIRLAVVPDLRPAATFARFAEEAITPGSVVLT